MTSSLSSENVQVFYYSALALSVGGGAFDPRYKVIFIPSMELQIDSDGSIRQTKKGVISEQALKAMDIYLEECNQGLREHKRKEILQIRDQVEAQVRQVTYLPRSLIVSAQSSMIEQKRLCEGNGNQKPSAEIVDLFNRVFL